MSMLANVENTHVHECRTMFSYLVTVGKDKDGSGASKIETYHHTGTQ